MTQAMTTGVLHPAAKKSISCIRARPWDDVAVKVRAPVREAERQAAMAECSDSTRIIMPPSSDLASHSASFS